MCTHNKIIIIPTNETQWGISDTYNVKCDICKEYIYHSLSYEDLNKLCKHGDIEIVSGKQYL